MGFAWWIALLDYLFLFFASLLNSLLCLLL